MPAKSTKFLPKEKRVQAYPDLVPLNNSRGFVYAYITFEEVEGRRAKLGEINALLSKIDLSEILTLIGYLNSQFTRPRQRPWFAKPAFQAAMVANFFSHDWRLKLAESRWGNTYFDTVIFHRQQLFLLLEVALVNSPISGGLYWCEESRNAFALAALMSNDLLSGSTANDNDLQSNLKQPKHPDALISVESKWKERATTLPVFDFHMESGSRNAVGRAHQLWIEIANDPAFKQYAGKDWVDWNRPFAEKYGLSISDFLNVVSALWLHLNAPSVHENPARFNSHRVFANTIAGASIDRTLDLISITASRFEHIISTQPRQRLGWDLTLFRRYPLIDLDNGDYAVIDQTFLLSVATEGVYWLISDALPDPKQFGNMFGSLYEYYSSRIFRRIQLSSQSTRNLQIHENAKFKPNGSSKHDEVADVLFTESSRVILVEIKGSLLTTHAKYSGSADDLKKNIDAKFVAPHGVGQLAKNIRRLAFSEKPNIKGYDAQSLRRIFPVLISYDTAITTPLICQYLNEMFTELLGPLPNSCPFRVGKVAILSSYDLELLESVCLTTPFAKLMQRYETECTADVPFRFFLFQHYAHLFDETNVSAADAFLDVGVSMKNLLFGADAKS